MTTAGGTSATSSADQFTYVAAPTVTAVSPNAGPTAGGTTVTITGTNFTGATAVDFGTDAGHQLHRRLATPQITADRPGRRAGTVDVTVTTPGGTSATRPADQFTYVGPADGHRGRARLRPDGGGTTVTITGTGFTGATAVDFGSDAATSFTVDSATQITATSPARRPGRSTSPSPRRRHLGDLRRPTSSPTSSAPTVTGVSPSSGPDRRRHLGHHHRHRLHRRHRGRLRHDAGHQLHASTPPPRSPPPPRRARGTVDVTVTTAGGTSATSVGRPVHLRRRRRRSPRSARPPGPTAGGTSVTITGTGFTGATAVDFGDTPAATFTVNSATQITATSPAGRRARWTSPSPRPGGTSATSAGDQFTYIAAPDGQLGVTDVRPDARGHLGRPSPAPASPGATAVDFGHAGRLLHTRHRHPITATSPAGPAGHGGHHRHHRRWTSATSPADQFTYVADSLPGSPTNLSAALGVGEAACRGALRAATAGARSPPTRSTSPIPPRRLPSRR